jgi:2-oxoacid:acceptor oxidoreductase gamma subunit (pyruvate/2-ketoisovalerate family)
MIEIEFIGTGGQGSVVAGKLFADAASKAGYVAQAFSAYGAQRRGGNVESYVRLSGEVIRNHSKIYGADYVIVMDRGLLERSQKEGKIRKGVTVMVNTSDPPDAFPVLKDCKVVTIDANRIASRNRVTLPSGTPVINSTMLGAIWAMIPSVRIEHLNDAFKDGKLPAVERNVAAAREAFDLIREWQETPGKRPAVADDTPIVGDLLPEYHPRLSPCEANCPAGEKVERTALFIKYGRFAEALESIRAENPFPGICGRVCFHPCEQNCNRVKFDSAVAANAL